MISLPLKCWLSFSVLQSMQAAWFNSTGQQRGAVAASCCAPQTGSSTAVTCSGVVVQADESKRHRQELAPPSAPAMSTGLGTHRYGDSATAATAWQAALNPMLEPSFGANSFASSGMSGGMVHSAAPASAPSALQVASLGAHQLALMQTLHDGVAGLADHARSCRSLHVP
jgi:hypothetical protein